MSFSLLRRTVAKVYPHWAAEYTARRAYRGFAKDKNNFTNIDDIRTVLCGYEVVSFDLFDTLVWRKIALLDVHRKTAEFSDSFVTGDRGPIPKGLLLNCRYRFQQAVKVRGMRQEIGYRNEVDLAEVFDGALEPYISDGIKRREIVEALILFEIQTEREVLVVDPKMRAALEKLKRDGKTLILMSDMYFSEEHIRYLLRSLGLLDLFDHVFVSATVGVTKNSGKLFEFVNSELDLYKRRKLHVGDDWNNDVVQPGRNKWDALHYLNIENEQRKRKLNFLAQLGEKNGVAERQKRFLKEALVGDETDSIRVMAASFSHFSRKTLEIAVQEKFDRILYLTRDGTIFRTLTEDFIERTSSGKTLNFPEMSELAFSRRAGVLLNYPEMDDPNWQTYLMENVFWLSQVPLSLRAIMRTFSVGIEELVIPEPQTKLVSECLSGTDPESDISFDLLLKRPRILKALHAALCIKRGQVRDYLDAMDLIKSGKKTLLVDIGYSGTAAKALAEYIYKLERRKQSVGGTLALTLFASNRYYDDNLGLMHPRVTMKPAVVIGVEDWRRRAVAANFSWLEPFAVDRSRGSLLGYRRNDVGMIEPEFGPGEADVASSVGRERICAAARSYEQLILRSPLSFAAADKIMTERMIDTFTRPNRKSVTFMRRITHHAGLTEVQSRSVVSRIRLSRLRRDVSMALREDRWVQGSLAYSGLGFLNPIVNRMIGLMAR